MNGAIGTFTIHGSKAKGYLIKDHDRFNDWGVRGKPNAGGNFATREEAEDYAQRCHDFKTGRRMSVG